MADNLARMFHKWSAGGILRAGSRLAGPTPSAEGARASSAHTTPSPPRRLRRPTAADLCRAQPDPAGTAAAAGPRSRRSTAPNNSRSGKPLAGDHVHPAHAHLHQPRRLEQPAVAGQAEGVTDAVAVAPACQPPAAEAAVSAEDDPHAGPRLAQAAHQQLGDGAGVQRRIDIGRPQVGRQELAAAEDEAARSSSRRSSRGRSGPPGRRGRGHRRGRSRG